jgi:hypothetical protein
LPELLTDVNAAAVGAVDIGVGDLFGSTLANMVVLAILDIVYARRRILHNVAFDHVLVGALAIVLTTLATAGIVANGFARLGPVGLETVLIVGLYLFGMHAVYAGRPCRFDRGVQTSARPKARRAVSTHRHQGLDNTVPIGTPCRSSASPMRRACARPSSERFLCVAHASIRNPGGSPNPEVVSEWRM